MAPNVLILRAPGVNCDEETAYAFAQAGAMPTRLHVQELLASPQRLGEFQILCLPGGFSYGDDIASGRVLGNQLRLKLTDALQEFRAAGKLVLGICNGFQVLMKTGLLDVDDVTGPQATLTWNDHGRYEARWVHVSAAPSQCVFLRGMEQFDLPIAHAEGKIMFRDSAAQEQILGAGRGVLQYVDQRGEVATEFPANPNGSTASLAGLCDSSGRIFGLMPHPERFITPLQHPSWTRLPQRKDGAGLQVFRNAVEYFA